MPTFTFIGIVGEDDIVDIIYWYFDKMLVRNLSA